MRLHAARSAPYQTLFSAPTKPEPYLTGIKLRLLWNEYEQFIEVEHRDEILAAKEQFRQTFDMSHERCHSV